MNHKSFYRFFIYLYMRFGHCKHCWWWELMKNHVYTGNCYMHNNKTEEDSYCPDYVNRRKENKAYGMTLDEWIESHKGKQNS